MPVAGKAAVQEGGGLLGGPPLATLGGGGVGVGGSHVIRDHIISSAEVLQKFEARLCFPASFQKGPFHCPLALDWHHATCVNKWEAQPLHRSPQTSKSQQVFLGLFCRLGGIAVFRNVTHALLGGGCAPM